jgi:tetratricopeptide (TPR) repeat protein
MTPRSKPTANPTEASAPPVAGWRRVYAPIALALIVLATFVVYWPAIYGGMLWDDNFYLTRPDLQSFNGLDRIWFDPFATAQYYPVVHSAFWLEHILWGDNYLGYHLANLLLHSLSVVLVYLLLGKLGIRGALLAAAIFALHPVMVESVAWMTEQKNTLSTVFYLSAMWLYLDFDDSRRRSRYFLSLGFFALALLSKTVTVTLPVALLLIFWWQRGAFSWRRDVWPLVPFFALSIASGAMTIWVERMRGAQGGDFAMTFVERTLVAGRDIWFYLEKLIWPSNLTFIYPRWIIDPHVPWQWIFPIAALALTVVLWLFRHRSRAPLAAWLFYCATLFPVLGFLNVFFFKYSFVADHFQYLASLGLIVLVSAGIARAIDNLPKPARYLGSAMCILLVGILALLTLWQTPMYADTVTLYETTIERNPNCWLAQNNLGKELADNGNQNGAVEHYRASLRIKPDYADAHNNLANAFSRTGRLPQAIDEFRVAIALDANDSTYHSNIASALTQLGRFQDAIDHCHEALRLQPNSFDAHHNLGTALLHARRLTEAIDELRTAHSLRPDDPVACHTLGAALSEAGQYPEAAQLLEHALRLNSNYTEAHYNLAKVLARIGQIPQAGEQFRQAIALNENFAAAHIDFGRVLDAQGNFPESIAHFEKAIQLGANQPDVQNNLGDAFRKSGQFDRAIEHYQAAVQLKPDYLPASANLAQTLALANRSQEAIAVAERAIEVAKKTNQQDELGQFEEWLRHYRTELQRAAGGATPNKASRPANEQKKPQ